MLIAIARALEGDARRALLDDARAQCAGAHPADRARILADAAMVEGSLSELDEAIALAKALPAYDDPWRILIDAARIHTRRAKELAKHRREFTPILPTST